MQEATKAEYRSLAANFYEKRLGGKPSPKRVTDALKAAAAEYRPAYWRRLRNAIAFDQAEKGLVEASERTAKTNNPVTNPANPTEAMRYEGVEIKTKQRRAKGVKPEDADKLAAFLDKKGDRAALAAMTICRHLGCRPAEIAGITIDPNDGRITVKGVKQRDDRGLAERVLSVDGSVMIKLMTAQRALERIAQGDISAEVNRIQDRITRAGHKLWPRRMAVPSLYSFRHQVGSDLKASGYSRQEIAYTMGHRSTESVEVYGDKRRASGGRTPAPAADADMSQVRENHREYNQKPEKSQAYSSSTSFDVEGPSM